MEENILKELRPSILGFLPAFVLPFTLFFIPVGGFRPFVVSFFWLLEMVLLFRALFFIYASKYKLCSDRIETVQLGQKGFSLDTVTIDYLSIQEIKVHQTFFQRVLKIGDLKVETAGIGQCLFKGIEDPVGVMHFILDLKQGAQ